MLRDKINLQTIGPGWYDSSILFTRSYRQAFKVVSKLIESGTIQEMKYEDFVKLVKQIEEIIR